MAKKSAIQKDKNRRKLVAQHAAKRARLKAIADNRDLPMEERFQARLKLAEMPRNGAKIRIRNRCEVTGRPRAFYRKFKMSRIALRDLGSTGQVPGLVKSSW
ncbi:MAG: 30S ribosomal protein S14 [Pseudomonadota bacterium]|jgi:small subunit ribosomal protein S14|nr:30S ribosomal protein S14 [Pseudomonadota bacterium]MEC7515619.1 30S ribosomal protein S14 [Pseudomonadota bacterium]MEC7591862.1 30S ribosomal protein S14 [Pseudomonadota bacterium]MEC7675225.1 30S ribosomal protein S14 [Pseudomonadota bacterium]MEC8060764.1 30S ribosomal protein S14 [Pseudomonadota bacterium]|tara:strand:- start:36 stop:341 length:306 start_codon:yes stop_codon:yes gene_type:complete